MPTLKQQNRQTSTPVFWTLFGIKMQTKYVDKINHRKTKTFRKKYTLLDKSNKISKLFSTIFDISYRVPRDSHTRFPNSKSCTHNIYSLRQTKKPQMSRKTANSNRKHKFDLTKNFFSSECKQIKRNRMQTRQLKQPQLLYI